jgi:hypothetical protein
LIKVGVWIACGWRLVVDGAHPGTKEHPIGQHALLIAG